MPHYHINIFWSDRDACRIADVPDLRYCSVHGETVADASREIEVAAEDGDAIPEPCYRPEPVYEAA
jgi:predicted RNase H-like HicB family nuclease